MAIHDIYETITPQPAQFEAGEEREDIQEMASAAEALLFSSAEPLTLGDLKKVLAVRTATLERVLEHLGRTLSEGKRGMRLQRHNDTVRLVTAPEMSLYIDKLRGQQAIQRLSEAALETLKADPRLVVREWPMTDPHFGVDRIVVAARVEPPGDAAVRAAEDRCQQVYDDILRDFLASHRCV